MTYEYINLNCDCTLTYVYEDDAHRLPLEKGMNVLPYTTLPVVLDKGFTLRHLLGVFDNYPCFEDLFFSNYLTLADMSTDHIQNNDLNYVSVGYVTDCFQDEDGNTMEFGQYACLEVCSGMEGLTFCEFTDYSLGEVIDLPMIAVCKNDEEGSHSKITVRDMPMGLFIQASIDAMSLCPVSVTTD